MKKILLTLLLMVAATATMSAQDELEQTAAPSIYCEDWDEYFYVTIENSDEDPDAVIYYCIHSNGELFYDWTVYDEMGLVFSVLGEYKVSAYAQTPGKSASEVVNLYFVISP